MKVVFYHYSMGMGGAERFIAYLSDYLVEQGEQVTILTSDTEPSFYKLDERVVHRHLDSAHHSRNFIDAISHNVKTMRKLKKVLREISPDVVLAFGPSRLFPLWLVRGMQSYRLIGSERTNPFLDQGGFWNHIKGWMADRCDGYIFQTEGAKSYYCAKTQASSKVLHNPVDVREFMQTPPLPWAERRQICAVGRLDTVKCYPDLLRAFSIVLERHPEAHLDLYGDGPQRKELDQLVQELQITHAIDLCGKSSNPFGVYQKHKIFVLSSGLEGMPNALMEAMGSGCACVATNCDFGPSELIRDGENGFLVPVHGIDEIADRICNLLEDDVLAEAMGNQARGILKSHNLNVIGANFHGYLREVIDKT